MGERERERRRLSFETREGVGERKRWGNNKTRREREIYIEGKEK